MSKISNLYSVDEWMSIFHTRTASHKNINHGWCKGSLKPISRNGFECDDCKKEMEKYPRRQGIPKNLTRPHTRKKFNSGLHLIRLGAVNGEGDWIKVGSAKEMDHRLFQHFRDRRHQYCEILHLSERQSRWKTTEGVEGLLVGRIRNEHPEKRLNEEYFPYTDEIVNRIVELMNNPELLLPDLLDEPKPDEFLIRSAA